MQSTSVEPWNILRNVLLVRQRPEASCCAAEILMAVEAETSACVVRVNTVRNAGNDAR